MDDAATATGTAVSAAAIEHLQCTENSTTGVRAKARATISEQAAYAYESAYALSGGGDLHRDAHDVAVTKLLHCTTRSITAFALHHLRPLLPDLTDEQWDRINAAVTALDLRIAEDLTGANGPDPDATQPPDAYCVPALPTGQTRLWGSTGEAGHTTR
ncbi:hypothetical protein ADK70_26915 [Streptomyces rimosus subsp. pseudoverticillatus]|uniref:hypothetical protein n=1 Tax=Streptomyces rimosus TaxID=1927 RepID=UPI0006B25F85|nr:hypothetical protein [Streptomyces rimosus]KOT80894.1 hypothetical protein ADK70_26915 [Streptomyces rimosus subsp. pseudoverticillatus]